MSTRFNHALHASVVFTLLAAGCSSDPSSSDGAGGGSTGGGANVTGEIFALVQGTLAGDLIQSQTIHDQAASAIRPQAEPAGDTAHYVYLSDPQDAQAFLGIDHWTDAKGFEATLSDPNTQQAFAAEFASAPEITSWKTRDGWMTFGSFSDLGAAGRAVLVSVRGKVAGSEANAMAIHNQVVASAPPHDSIGNLSHIVLKNVVDADALLVLEVWVDADAQQQFYANPEFGEAVAQIFDGPPTIRSWKPTSWYQWQPADATNTCDGTAICWGEGSCMNCALAGPCATQAAACEGNADCMALSACAQACKDDACRSNCVEQHPNGAADFGSLTNCVVCGECPVDCGSPSFQCA